MADIECTVVRKSAFSSAITHRSGTIQMPSSDMVSCIELLWPMLKCSKPHSPPETRRKTRAHTRQKKQEGYYINLGIRL